MACRADGSAATMNERHIGFIKPQTHTQDGEYHETAETYGEDDRDGRIPAGDETDGGLQVAGPVVRKDFDVEDAFGNEPVQDGGYDQQGDAVSIR